MMYYNTTIEQIIKDGELAEYGATEKVADLNSALSKYYKKLSDVSADLGKNHTYMNIKIVNSYGVVVKEDTVGNYLESLVENATTEVDE
ncbi:MAG: hypothetical protein J5614_04885 [Paludibacteraceae bacterium]|nr:hypothetical protein [Paludibacteraceae bacterium]